MLLIKNESWTGFNILNNDGSNYEGETDLNGIRHGQGKCIYCDGSSYEGQWLNGFYHGKGTLIMPTGHKYCGEWKNG